MVPWVQFDHPRNGRLPSIHMCPVDMAQGVVRVGVGVARVGIYVLRGVARVGLSRGVAMVGVGVCGQLFPCS